MKVICKTLENVSKALENFCKSFLYVWKALGNICTPFEYVCMSLEYNYELLIMNYCWEDES